MDENPSTRLQYPPRIISSMNHTRPKPPQKSSLKQQPQNFPSHLDAPDVSPSVRGLCEILIRASPHDIESTLSSSDIAPTQDLVNEVLRFSYNYPSSAVKFFRWAGLSLKHSAFSWNLIVDLLGKNGLFEPMWDAIRSMNQERVVSLATFVSVFGSYCVTSRFDEAIMSFGIMDKYGVQQDVVAGNSLLSAICHEENQTSKALEWFERIKSKIPPNDDTFAILLEGWERDGNVAKAMTTFGEMVVRIGWSPDNMSAYDAFLTTLVHGHHLVDAVKFLKLMRGFNCLPSLKFFSNALDILIKQNDSSHAILLWDIMVGSGLLPNLIMYNAMIGLLYNNNEIHDAIRLLNIVGFHGSFPDSLPYNLIFQCLIKNKKVREVGKFFIEMIKHEWPPTPSNFSAAITMLFDGDDPEMALEI
ncbi:Tetratricopeptide repeat-like superfamily protein isoform 1 [Tripterygium wilfordii]|uniref:Tetratricopeptide repeat-like superfamily protein isoform 1 n=1 Tax=Tripterygium wilfordii TaxID=458696 RepID=A0A7J7CM72_TRIWF|nr:pentatricopeptide repeat-containing protein At1g77360, mitochondrial-like isoform X2 [Tripterygium wilfordii]KAF5735139.1 Tetratricopeptide repeat-like superfamily protein isoform 1 [Tripterygium wilfordii]